MSTVFLVLVLVTLLLVILSMMSKVPLWTAVLMLTIIELLRVLPGR